MSYINIKIPKLLSVKNIFYKILSGDADMTNTALLELFNFFYDFLVPYLQAKSQYVTRAPQPVTSLDNITKQFSVAIWTISLITTFLLACLLLFTYSVYTSKHLKA